MARDYSKKGSNFYSLGLAGYPSARPKFKGRRRLERVAGGPEPMTKIALASRELK